MDDQGQILQQGLSCSLTTDVVSTGFKIKMETIANLFREKVNRDRSSPLIHVSVKSREVSKTEWRNGSLASLRLHFIAAPNIPNYTLLAVHDGVLNFS